MRHCPCLLFLSRRPPPMAHARAPRAHRTCARAPLAHRPHGSRSRSPHGHRPRPTPVFSAFFIPHCTPHAPALLLLLPTRSYSTCPSSARCGLCSRTSLRIRSTAHKTPRPHRRWGTCGSSCTHPPRISCSAGASSRRNPRIPPLASELRQSQHLAVSKATGWRRDRQAERQMRGEARCDY
jgi:hypothetical protein